MPIQRAAAKPKVIGQSPAAKPDETLVNTATLIRGRVYVFKNQRFDVGVPVIVDDKLASILEEKVNITEDTDGEEFEKSVFVVRRGVPPPPPPVDPNAKVRRRLPTRA
jgi:hypothetical protein